ncbi:TEL2-interacting protein 1 [Chytriomyces hyalinus]|nr:TEL2-interacting protein 1 [Chytriomyces hyalinus]
MPHIQGRLLPLQLLQHARSGASARSLLHHPHFAPHPQFKPIGIRYGFRHTNSLSAASLSNTPTIAMNPAAGHFKTSFEQFGRLLRKSAELSLGIAMITGGGFIVDKLLNKETELLDGEIDFQHTTNHPSQAVEKSNEFVRQYLNDTYSVVGFGLLLTAASTYVFSCNPIFNVLCHRHAVGMSLGTLMASGVLSNATTAIPPEHSRLKYSLFTGFALAKGAFVTSALIVSPALLARAGIYGAGIIGSTAYIGATTKSDNYIYMGGPLLAAVVSSALAMNIRTLLPQSMHALSTIHKRYLFVGMLLFQGMVLRDMEKVIHRGHDVMEGREKRDVVNEAVDLYLEFLDIAHRKTLDTACTHIIRLTLIGIQIGESKHADEVVSLAEEASRLAKGCFEKGHSHDVDILTRALFGVVCAVDTDDRATSQSGARGSTQREREAVLAAMAALAQGGAMRAWTRDIVFAIPFLLRYGQVVHPNKLPKHTASVPVSDEIKENALQCLVATLSSSDDTHDHPLHFETPSSNSIHVSYFASTITAILDTLSSAAASNKRQSALCLDALLRIVSVCLSAVDAAKIMPGIVSAVALMFQKNGFDKLGASLVSKSLALLECLVVKILGAGDWLDRIEEASPSTLVPTNESEDIRTADWLTQTLEKLAIVFSHTLTNIKMRIHQSDTVRKNAAQVCCCILSKCRRSLGHHQCHFILLDTFVSFVEDEVPAVQLACRNVSREMVESREDVFTESFNRAMGAVNVALKSVNDDTKADCLRIACGYISCLENKVARLEFSADLNALLDLLLISRGTDAKNSGGEIISFSKSNVKVIEDRDFALLALNDSHVLSTDSKYSGGTVKQFEMNQGEPVVGGVSRILQLLACHGNSVSIFNRFITCFDDVGGGIEQDALLFLLNEFCRGFNVNGKSAGVHDFAPSKDKDMLRSLIMTYLNSNLLNLSTTRGLKLSETRGAIKSLNSNIISTCLVLEGLSIASKGLGADFEPFLMDTLYIVIEKIGDPNRVVSSTALRTLDAFRESVGSPSNVALVVDNVDYLVNALTKRLRYLAEYPNTPLMLRALLHVCGAAALPFLDDAFEDILMAIDFNQGDGVLIGTVFGALDSLVVVLKDAQKQHRLVEDASISCEENGPAVKGSKQMRDFIAEFHQRKEELKKLDVLFDAAESVRKYGAPFESNISDSEIKTDQQVMEEENAKEAAESENNAPPLSSAEQMAEKILLKAQHFLMRDDPYMQSLLLRLSANSSCLLAAKPRTLNPLVHILWPSILTLLASEHHFVVMDALNLIETIASVSKEFLLKRFVTDLLPRMETVLGAFSGVPVSVQHAAASSQVLRRKQSKREVSGMRDVHSVVFKIVAKCLVSLQQIVRAMPAMTVQDLSRVLDMVWPFLEVRQHDVLKRHAANVVEAVSLKDGSDVWVRSQRGLAVETPGYVLKPPASLAGRLRELRIPLFMKDQMKGMGTFVLPGNF